MSHHLRSALGGLCLLSAALTGCIEDPKVQDDPEQGEAMGGAGGEAAPMAGAGGELGAGGVAGEDVGGAPPLPPVQCADEAPALLTPLTTQIEGSVRWEAMDEAASPWPAASALTLRERYSGWSARVEIDEGGRFDAPIYAGVYEITLDRCREAYDCTQSGVPVAQGWVVEADGPVEPADWVIGVKPMQGAITQGGAALPAEALEALGEGQSSPAHLVLTDTSTNRPWITALSPDDTGGFTLWALPGRTYQAMWSQTPAIGEHLDTPLPSGQIDLGEARFEGDDGPFDLELPTTVASVSGRLLAGGAPLPDREGQRDTLPRGTITLQNREAPGNAVYIEIPPHGVVDFGFSVPPGEYDVLFQTYFLVIDDVEVPGYTPISLCPEGCAIEDGVELVVDLLDHLPLPPTGGEVEPSPTHTVTGRVQVGGDWPAPGGEPVGTVLLTNQDPTPGLPYGAQYIRMDVDAEGRFSGEAPSGRFAVSLSGCTYECTADTPRGYTDFGVVEIDGPAELSYEVTVVDVPIHVTVNGQEMPDDTLLGETEGYLTEQRAVLRLDDPRWSGVELFLGETGPVQLHQRMFAGRATGYIVSGELTGRELTWYHFRQDALPGGYYNVGELEIAPGATWDIDLEVVSLTHTVDAEGALPGSDAFGPQYTPGDHQVLVLANPEGDRLWSRSHPAGAPITMKAYSGAYQALLYSGGGYPDMPSNAEFTHENHTVGVPLGPLCL